jgi:predicted DsbA family dithiol-disulfide isomerase
MQIDVFHDTACPWCRIGKRHLSNARAAWQGEAVSIQFRPYFLNAAIPAEGYDFQSYMRQKGDGVRDLEQWFAAPRAAGAQVGLRFQFERISKAPNTLLSHLLIEATPDPQRHAVIDALYDAYFEHGQDIGSRDTLLQIASDHGLERDSIAQQFDDPQHRNSLLRAAEEAVAKGVTGVPFFVFNGRYGLSGAQPPSVLLQVMHQVEKEAIPS